MLKIVVFDSGFGGELFADQLEAELPVTEVIRVIDWRNAEIILTNAKLARKVAEKALKPYLGKVDLIVFANYMLSVTSLGYFRRKYKDQKFVGFSLRPKRMMLSKTTLIMTTKATTKNWKYLMLKYRVKAKTICLDSWPLLIDDGELTSEKVKTDLSAALSKLKNFLPEQIMLACGQFTELKPQFREVFGHNARIVDSFRDTLDDVCKTLKIKTLRKRK